VDNGGDAFKNAIINALTLKQWEKQFASGDKPEKIPPADRIARDIAEEYGHQLVWNNEAHSWMRYQADASGVWSVETDAYIEHMVGGILDSKGITGYGSYSYITNIVKHLGRLLFVRTWKEASPKEFLPFDNGVLQLATGKLLPHSPGYRFTWSLPRQHNPLATDWNTIDRWLNEATGNKPQLKKILLCWLNACLKGRSDLQMFLHLTGPGGTGKGTFTRLTTALIGERNTHSSTLTDWNTNRFESANGYMKRLINFPDEDKYTGNLGNFKRLTGGDDLRGENKGQKAFQYRYDGMVMIASNYPIFASDTSSGMHRRTLVVPFHNQVLKGLRRNLEEEFRAELDALTNYVLSIPDAEVTATIRQLDEESTEVTRETWEYRMRVDSIAAWLNEMVIHDAESSEAIGDDKDNISTLFGSYYQFTAKTGGRPKGIKEFSPNLLELCRNILGWTDVDKLKTRVGRFMKGLRLRRRGEDDSVPCPIEALYEGESVTDVSRHVTASVTAEVLTVQGCDGCDGSLDFLEEAKETTSELKIVPSEDEIHPSQDLSPVTANAGQGFSHHTQESRPGAVTDATHHELPQIAPKPGTPVRVHCQGSKRDRKTGVVCRQIDAGMVQVRLSDTSLPVEMQVWDCMISWLEVLKE
jgi:putative DNA primase/helicase